MSFCRRLERLRKATMLRRILHRRGEVICTLVLLLLLCLLLYTQQGLLSSGWSKPQLKLEIHSSTSSSRILLGARGARGPKGDQEPSQVTSELRLPLCETQTIPDISEQSRPQTRSPQTQSRSRKKKKKKKAAAGTKTTGNVPPAPTVPPFDFEGYLREKDNRNFKLLIDQPKKCDIRGEEDGGGSRSEAPYLLIAVKSTAADFDKRQLTENCLRGLAVFLDQLQVRQELLTLTVEAHQDLCLRDVWLSCMKVVRQTWGKEEGPLQPGVSIRTLFLLGIPRNRSSLPLWERLLAYESRTFRDILVWDFEDTFFNLTLKETHFLDWVNSSCPHVKFIFKGDADVYVNVENILEMLLDRDPEEDLFVGDIIVHAKPIRRRSSKYFVPEFLYGGGLYPNYAGGGGFVMSGRTARRLSSACRQVELFPIDDVFLGMCLQLIGVKASRHQGFRTFGIPRPSAAPHLQTFDPCFYKELMVVHSLSVPQIWLMWNLLHDQKLSCHNQTSLRSRPFKWRGKGRVGDVTEYGEKKVFITRDQLED